MADGVVAGVYFWLYGQKWSKKFLSEMEAVCYVVPVSFNFMSKLENSDKHGNKYGTIARQAGVYCRWP